MKQIILLVAALVIIQPMAFSQSREEIKSINREVERYEKRVEKAYDKLVQEIKSNKSPNQKEMLESLKGAQEAWKKFCEQQAMFVVLHGGAGGVGRQAGAALYHLELLKARLKDLEEVPNPF